MEYLTLKSIHTTLVAISILGFVIRLGGRISGAGWMEMKIIRIAPHMIDTLLLISGVWLWIMLAYGAAPWLIGKMIFLLIYIGAGIFALRKTSSNRTRIIAALIALSAVVLMAMSAVQKQIPF